MPTEFRDSIEDKDSRGLSYMDLIKRDADTPPASYRFTAGQRAFALELTEKLVAVGEMSGPSLEEDAPSPEPAFRIRPKY